MLCRSRDEDVRGWEEFKPDRVTAACDKWTRRDRDSCWAEGGDSLGL